MRSRVRCCDRSTEHFAGDKETAEKLEALHEMRERRTSGVKTPFDSNGFVPGINLRPTERLSFSAICKSQPLFLRHLRHG